MISARTLSLMLLLKMSPGRWVQIAKQLHWNNFRVIFGKRHLKVERSRESKLHTTSSLIIFRPGQLVCINRWVCVLGNVQLIAFDNDYSYNFHYKHRWNDKTGNMRGPPANIMYLLLAKYEGSTRRILGQCVYSTDQVQRGPCKKGWGRYMFSIAVPGRLG